MTHYPPFALSQPAVSNRLKVLERAGLISRGRDSAGRCLDAKLLAEITAWPEGYRQFWEGRFQRLDAGLDKIEYQLSVGVSPSSPVIDPAEGLRTGLPKPIGRVYAWRSRPTRA